jgi:hypothetical protein
MTERPPVPPLPLMGGCACGAVRYRVTARPHAVNACHCKDCQRLAGADAAIFLHLDTPAVTLAQGEIAFYRRTADSGRLIDVARCAACGTRLWHAPLAVPELTLISAGTLDDSGWAIPTSHIWLKRANGTMPPADDTLRYDESPTDRRILWDRFAELYPA